MTPDRARLEAIKKKSSHPIYAGKTDLHWLVERLEEALGLFEPIATADFDRPFCIMPKEILKIRNFLLRFEEEK